MTCVKFKGYHPLTCKLCLKGLKLWLSERLRRSDDRIGGG